MMQNRNKVKKLKILKYLKEKNKSKQSLSLSQLKKKLGIYYINKKYLSRSLILELATQYKIPIKFTWSSVKSDNFKIKILKKFLKKKVKINEPILKKDILKLGFSTIYNKNITIEYLKNFAQRHKISLKFKKSAYKHGCLKYKSGCRCEICKLAESIRCRFKTNFILADYVSNNHIQMNLSPLLFRNRKFAEFILNHLNQST